MGALSSQGTTIEFNGNAIGNLVSLNGNFSTASKEIRQLAKNLTEDTQQYLSIYEKTTCDQTVELETICSSFDLASVGTTGKLSVRGDSWSFTFGVAYLEGIKLTAKVGDVLRLNYSFKRSYQ